MMRKLWAMAVVLGVVAGLTSGTLSAAEPKDQPTGMQRGAAVGQSAPAFTLKDLAGKEHKLADYKGKVVVLEWINFACPVIQRVHEKDKIAEKTAESFKGKDVVWLTIDSTRPDFGDGHSVADIKKWTEEAAVKLPFPVLVDADGAVARLYNAKTTPHVFVIDKDGKLVYAGAIDDDQGGNKKESERTNYVAVAVNATLAGKTVQTTETSPYGCKVHLAGETAQKDAADKDKPEKHGVDKGAAKGRDRKEKDDK